MALVVFVFAAILMLAQGLQKTLVETGSYDNVIVIRKGSTTEVQSGVDRLQAAIIEAEPEVAMGADGKPLLAKEMLVLVTLPRRGTLEAVERAGQGDRRGLSGIAAAGAARGGTASASGLP